MSYTCCEKKVSADVQSSEFASSSGLSDWQVTIEHLSSSQGP